MAETLLLWFNRFTDNPGKVRDRLNGRPVLLYEPPETLTPSPDQDYLFRTQSGITVPVMGGGDPMAAVVEKTKENAFMQRVTIGRTNNNDIVLEDVSVSRFHAFLEQDEGVWKLVDAGSRNGTLVGGKKLSVRVGVVLQNGALLRIGSVALTFFTANGFLEHLKRRGLG